MEMREMTFQESMLFTAYKGIAARYDDLMFSDFLAIAQSVLEKHGDLKLGTLVVLTLRKLREQS